MALDHEAQLWSLLIESKRLRDRKRRRPVPRVPAEPLLRLVDATPSHHSPAHEVALRRARKTGMVTERQADRLAVELLGLTPLEVWGDAWR